LLVEAFRLLKGYKHGFYILCIGAVIVFFANIDIMLIGFGE